MSSVEALAYARTGAPEFIERIEHRSSLLMMTGHDVVDGTLTELYKFRHLTFQEYLTARAIVDGWYPNRQGHDTLVSLLEPHLEEEKWREVIPLTAVLAGRRADELVRNLTDRCTALEPDIFVELRPVALALGNCLADEVQVIPDTLQRALQELIRHGMEFERSLFTAHLSRGKYGSLLREEAGRAFLDGKPDRMNSSSALAQTVFHQLVIRQSVEAYEGALTQLREYLASAEVLRRCEGALGIMFISYKLRGAPDDGKAISCGELLHVCADALVPLLFSENVPSQFSACWALA